jgi:hypothetical protein
VKFSIKKNISAADNNDDDFSSEDAFSPTDLSNHQTPIKRL